MQAYPRLSLLLVLSAAGGCTALTSFSDLTFDGPSDGDGDTDTDTDGDSDADSDPLMLSVHVSACPDGNCREETDPLGALIVFSSPYDFVDTAALPAGVIEVTVTAETGTFDDAYAVIADETGRLAGGGAGADEGEAVIDVDARDLPSGLYRFEVSVDGEEDPRVETTIQLCDVRPVSDVIALGGSEKGVGLAFGDGQYFAAWHDDEKLTYRLISDGESGTLEGGSRSPSRPVVARGDNGWAVAWTAGNDGAHDAFVAYVRDEGVWEIGQFGTSVNVRSLDLTWAGGGGGLPGGAAFIVVAHLDGGADAEGFFLLILDPDDDPWGVTEFERIERPDYAPDGARPAIAWDEDEERLGILFHDGVGNEMHFGAIDLDSRFLESTELIDSGVRFPSPSALAWDGGFAAAWGYSVGEENETKGVVSFYLGYDGAGAQELARIDGYTSSVPWVDLVAVGHDVFAMAYPGAVGNGGRPVLVDLYTRADLGWHTRTIEATPAVSIPDRMALARADEWRQLAVGWRQGNESYQNQAVALDLCGL